MRCFWILLLVSIQVFAQHSEQPVKESSADLRNQSVLFSIEIPSEKKNYQLERSSNQDYFLRAKLGSDDEIRKIDSRTASKLDREYAAKFIRCQYEIPSVDGDCKVTLRLSMKGEIQEICAKDEKKTQEITAFIQTLSKRF